MRGSAKGASSKLKRRKGRFFSSIQNRGWVGLKKKKQFQKKGQFKGIEGKERAGASNSKEKVPRGKRRWLSVENKKGGGPQRHRKKKKRDRRKKPEGSKEKKSGKTGRDEER